MPPLFSSHAVLVGTSKGPTKPSEGGSWVRLFDLNNIHNISLEIFYALGSNGYGRDTFDQCGYCAMTIQYHDDTGVESHLQLVVYDIDLVILHEKFYSQLTSANLARGSHPVIRDNGNIVITRHDDGTDWFLEEYTANTFLQDVTYIADIPVMVALNNGSVCAHPASGFNVLYFANGVGTPRYIDQLDDDVGGTEITFFSGCIDYKRNEVFLNNGGNTGGKSKSDDGYIVGVINPVDHTGETYRHIDPDHTISGIPSIPLGLGKWITKTGLGWIICQDGHPINNLTGAPDELFSAGGSTGTRTLHPTLNRCWMASSPLGPTSSTNSYIGYLNHDLTWGNWSKITLDGDLGFIDGIEALPDGSVYLAITFYGGDSASPNNVVLLYRYEYSPVSITVTINGYVIVQAPSATPATISTGSSISWTFVDNTVATSSSAKSTTSDLGVAGSDIADDYGPSNLK